MLNYLTVLVYSRIFIPGYCYSWHYNKVWGINLTWDKPKTDWIEDMNRWSGTLITRWGGWVGRQSPSCRTKWSEWDHACQCFLLYILICISLINSQGWYLLFRWDVNSIIFIPGYCYSWHYYKVWGINLTFPKLPNHTPLYKNPIIVTPLPITNPSPQSLILTVQIQRIQPYKLSYIYSFTITNIALHTIQEFEVI